MTYSKRIIPFFAVIMILLLFNSCQSAKEKERLPDKDMVSPEELESHIQEHIQSMLNQTGPNRGKLNDSTQLHALGLLDSFYSGNQYKPGWSYNGEWVPAAKSLIRFIDRSENYGLFPSDYHANMLRSLNRLFLSDSNETRNAAFWSRADLLLSDAFFGIVHDLKLGRLEPDSVTLRADSVLAFGFYDSTLQLIFRSGNVTAAFEALEPRLAGYDSLKAYLSDFLQHAKFKPLTYIRYPYTDTVAFLRSLQSRLTEEGLLKAGENIADTALRAAVLRKYQKEHDLKPTGKVNEQLVTSLNDTDWEKFEKIAINLDRYKQLPDSLPPAYAWVNLPGFSLHVYDADTVAFYSRVIVGGPKTRTPVLTSEITNFITFPQWTVPYSIIFKEMLPKLQKGVEWLTKENLMIVDKNDSVLDPHKIDWKKMNKNHFPFQIKQKQGDDNSLGVIKFNFRNKYSVYMHDTNVRWMFGKSFRALSHGCVRVKEWQKVASFLIRKDTLKIRPDSLKAWIKRQEKHVISGFPRLPIYIRYFTAEGKDGKITFYDDIYGDDKMLIEKYFGNKNVQ